MTPGATTITLIRMVLKFTTLSLGCIGLLLGITAQAKAPRPFPPRPDYYVLDEARVLDGRATHAIESLLTEHDRLTNEQVMVAIFKNAHNTSPQIHNSEKEWTHRLFVEWKIGKRHYNEGILLTIFLESGQAFLEVGYGLEPKLSKTAEILEQVVIPQLRHNDPKSAAIWGAYQILEELMSPLIQNGKAIEILRRDGIPARVPLTEEFADRPADNSGAWLVLCFLGISLITFVFYQILSREAHFTAKGWYLDYPWSSRKLRQATPKATSGNAKLKDRGAGAHSPIVEAIRFAEESFSGQIRVHLSKRWVEKDPARRAQQLLDQYKMVGSSARNSILIYVNLRKGKFSILGNAGINRVIGRHHWEEMSSELSEELSENLRSTQSERAIAFTVASVGQTLKKYFPSKAN